MHIWWRAHQGVTLFAKPYNFIPRVIRRTGTKRSRILGRIVCAALAYSKHIRASTHGKITTELPEGLEVDALREARDSLVNENELDF